MIIYNVTVVIANTVEEDWLEWMQNVHILDVMATKLFKDAHFCRVLLPDDGDEEYTKYAIQYWMESMDKFNEYQEKYAKKLQLEHTERYRNKFMAIRSIMETI